jgi:penicillin-binding protein 1A
MTRAFASVAAKGVDVVPYGITRVTANGQTIYTHEVDRSRVLVAPYVAAEMTDLLQTAVNTGTGREAQIGRPVAGKTGTTTSLKDGWFLGFSSGLTTGVWMGRDDARPVRGLHGGTAPARAFAAFMKPATAIRPVEQFDTQVTLPEWQLEPDEASYFGTPDEGVQVDEDGNPIAPAPATDATIDPETAPATTPAEPAAPPARSPQQQLDDLIDSVTRDTPAPAPPARTAPPAAATPPRQPPPAQQQPQPGAARPTQ